MLHLLQHGRCFANCVRKYPTVAAFHAQVIWIQYDGAEQSVKCLQEVQGAWFRLLTVYSEPSQCALPGAYKVLNHAGVLSLVTLSYIRDHQVTSIHDPYPAHKIHVYIQLNAL